MASCYLCGRSNAYLRRWVPVSRSQRVYIGRRGISGGSSGRSQGLRTVCTLCADKMAKSQNILGCIVLAVFAAFALYCWYSDGVEKQARADQEHQQRWAAMYKHEQDMENMPALRPGH